MGGRVPIASDAAKFTQLLLDRERAVLEETEQRTQERMRAPEGQWAMRKVRPRKWLLVHQI